MKPPRGQQHPFGGHPRMIMHKIVLNNAAKKVLLLNHGGDFDNETLLVRCHW
jgi:hypothetical protein